jgi:hypothetical protein
VAVFSQIAGLSSGRINGVYFTSFVCTVRK